MIIVSSLSLLFLYLTTNSLLALSKNECYDSWQCESSSLEGLTLCLGYCSCQAATISTEYYLTCNGYRSCIDSDISATDTIACNENYSCQNAKLSTSDILRCNGDYACFNADVDAATIISNGMYSLYAARIDTKHNNNNDELNIYVNGYLSGYNADIICRSGSKCNLICQGNACNELEFACLDGAICNVSPAVCTANNKPNVIDDFADGKVSCPLWTYSSSKHDDKILINRLDQRRLNSLDDEEKIPKLSDLESPSIPIFGENNDNEDMLAFHHRQVRPRNNDDDDKAKFLSSESMIPSVPELNIHVHFIVICSIIICAIIMISSCLWFCHTKYVNRDYKPLDSN